MSDFAPPTGPPPPRVPEGWKAVYNQQYQEWFYVNLHTKESTWEKPTAPALRPGDDAPPSGPPPPPGYSAGPNAPNVSDAKKTPLESNNPFNTGHHESDEEMARRLQREEESRMRGSGTSPRPGERGAADTYYSQGQSYQPQSPGIQGGYPGAPSQNTYPQQTDSKRGSGGGFFGKLKDKFGGPQGSSAYPPRPAGYGNQPGGYMPNQGYGGYPQQQGHYPQQQYGGYPQGQYMQAQQKKKHGLGAGGAAALGVGGGLLGGMLLADAIEDHDQAEYDQGFADGGGDDFGGGDF